MRKRKTKKEKEDEREFERCWKSKSKFLQQPGFKREKTKKKSKTDIVIKERQI